MKKFRGDLKGFPEEVVNKMLDFQEEQCNKRNVSVFEKDRCADYMDGGFYWSQTEEGDSFWLDVIVYENFDLFFEKYPKKTNKMKVFKGDLKDFPEEVVNKMLDCQEQQGNKKNISVFEMNICDGFRWNETSEGWEFWDKVINGKDFDLFFEKYPKTEEKCSKDTEANTTEFCEQCDIVSIKVVGENLRNSKVIAVEFDINKEGVEIKGRTKIECAPIRDLIIEEIMKKLNK